MEEVDEYVSKVIRNCSRVWKSSDEMMEDLGFPILDNLEVVGLSLLIVEKVEQHGDSQVAEI